NYLHIFFTASSYHDIYTLYLHDALPIFPHQSSPIKIPTHLQMLSPESLHTPAKFQLIELPKDILVFRIFEYLPEYPDQFIILTRSEEHTSELQSRENIVCRLLLEKKKIK